MQFVLRNNKFRLGGSLRSCCLLWLAYQGIPYNTQGATPPRAIFQAGVLDNGWSECKQTPCEAGVYGKMSTRPFQSRRSCCACPPKACFGQNLLRKFIPGCVCYLYIVHVARYAGALGTASTRGRGYSSPLAGGLTLLGATVGVEYIDRIYYYDVGSC